jgi:hypothetical protein
LNVTLAMDHAENAAKLIDDAYYFDEDIVDDADFIKKYNEALNTHNSTIHALVVAIIIDQILKDYSEAFDIGYDLTNMSNMMRAPNMTSYSLLSNNKAKVDINSSTIQNNNSHLVNIADFQSTQKLSEKASQIFESNLLSNNTDASIIPRLEKSIDELNYLVDSKAPAQELMMVVHGHIHPNLQLAYDLNLKMIN